MNFMPKQTQSLFIRGLLASSVFIIACNKGGDSSTETYTNGELKANYENSQAKAKYAVEKLKNAGWCQIPEKSRPYSSALKRKYSAAELMQYMACVSNKESTLGKEKVNYSSDSGDGMGMAIGLWQVKAGHVGESYTLGNRRLTCGSSLQNDANSATCALITFMLSADRNGDGLYPWEAVCSQSDANLKNSKGELIFKATCDDCDAGLKPKISLSTDQTAWHIEVGVNPQLCSATQVAVELVDTTDSKLPIVQTVSVPFTLASGTKVAVLDLPIEKSPSATVARVKIMNGSEVLGVTNPSPKLPILDKTAKAEKVDKVEQKLGN